MMNLIELVNEFSTSVAAQSDAIAKGDPAAGNEFAMRYVTAFEKLCANGDDGRDALATLLAHDRRDVRVMAAAYLLRHCGDRARTVLETEARGRDLVSFGAAQALQRWKDGTWKLDPE